MSIGTRIDRAINAALIRAADSANRVMELAFPRSEDGSPLHWADILADREANREVFDAPHSCAASGPSPEAVDGSAPPAGAGPVAGAGTDAAGTGGHPDRATSELLLNAARELDFAYPAKQHAIIRVLIAELRDRAAYFAECIDD